MPTAVRLSDLLLAPVYASEIIKPTCQAELTTQPTPLSSLIRKGAYHEVLPRVPCVNRTGNRIRVSKPCSSSGRQRRRRLDSPIQRQRLVGLEIARRKVHGDEVRERKGRS